MSEWWHERDSEIGDFEIKDEFYRSIHARETDEGWEYAIVHWHFGTPSLMCLLKNGKTIS